MARRLAAAAALALAAAPAARAVDLNLAVFAPVEILALSEDACASKSGKWNADESTCFQSDEFSAMGFMAVLAARDFNKKDPRFVSELSQHATCDVQINLRIWDTSLLSNVTVKNTIAMREEVPDTHGVVGPAASANCIPSSLINTAFDIPQISYWATATELDKEVYGTFMRVIPSDADVARSVCAFWNRYNYEHAAVLFTDDTYGEAYKEGILSGCRELGINGIETFSFSLENPESISIAVQRIADSKIKTILLVALQGALSQVVADAVKLDLFDDAMWIVSDGISGDEVNALPEAHRAKFNGTLRVVSAGGVDTQAASHAAYRRFAEGFDALDSSEISQDPDLGSAVLPSHWVGNSELFQAVNHEDVLIKDVGTYMYDAVMAFGISACQLGWAGGEALPFKRSLLAHLTDSNAFSMHGLSGVVQLGADGNRLTSSSTMEISNFVFKSGDPAVSRAVLGYFSNAEWDVNDGEIVFTSGSLVVPSNIEPVSHDKNYAGVLKYILYVFGAINILTAISLFVWTLFHRKHIVVKASQVPFLSTIAIGVMISSTTIFILTIDDEGQGDEALEQTFTGTFALGNMACMLAVWLYSVGFTISFGGLFARIWRIRRLFASSNNSLKPVIVPNSLILMIILGLLLLDVSILLAWTHVSPLTLQREATQADRFGQTIESSAKCISDQWVTFVIILGAFHLAVLGGGNWLAFKCRNINSMFSEGKWIGICMTSYMQLLVLGVPVLLSVGDNAATLMFVKGCIVWLNDLSLLGFIWGPKVGSVYGWYSDTSGQGGNIFDQATMNSSSKSKSDFHDNSNIGMTSSQGPGQINTFNLKTLGQPRGKDTSFYRGASENDNDAYNEPPGLSRNMPLEV